jgi:hypothetical protein
MLGDFAAPPEPRSGHDGTHIAIHLHERDNSLDQALGLEHRFQKALK